VKQALELSCVGLVAFSEALPFVFHLPVALRLLYPLKSNDFAWLGQTVQIVRPVLHHLPALGQIHSMVVCCSNFIAFIAGQLPLNPIRDVTGRRWIV
jgi:hypothetical protein